MIAAALAGGAAGVGVLFRMYGNRFLGIFSKKRRDKAREDALALSGSANTQE